MVNGSAHMSQQCDRPKPAPRCLSNHKRVNMNIYSTPGKYSPRTFWREEFQRSSPDFPRIEYGASYRDRLFQRFSGYAEIVVLRPPGHPGTCTLGHATPRLLPSAVGIRRGWPFLRSFVPDFNHPDTRTPGYVDTWTPGHPDTCIPSLHSPVLPLLRSSVHLVMTTRIHRHLGTCTL